MISHQHKCIFVEVPKTGSSSIRKMLGGIPPKPHMNLCQMKQELERYWTNHDLGNVDSMKNRLREALYLLLPAEKRRRRGRRIFDSYFKFGFVRNPWDRTVSLYERREGLQLREKMTFEEFVEWMDYASSTCIHPVPHRLQFDWFTDPHGVVMANFIGRFENLEADWNHICQKIGIKVPLPHENRNPRRERHYSEYYSSRSRDLIARKFQEDIQRFGYRFENRAAPRSHRFVSVARKA
jgi:hypothetical protein